MEETSIEEKIINMVKTSFEELIGEYQYHNIIKILRKKSSQGYNREALIVANLKVGYPREYNPFDPYIISKYRFGLLFSGTSEKLELLHRHPDLQSLLNGGDE